jgi:DNA-binding CsgD family transcriptional regulator
MVLSVTRGFVVKPEQLSNLIDRIYTAALDSESWAQVSLDIQNHIGGHSVNFVIEDTKIKRVHYLFSNGVSESDFAYYQTNVIHRDELTQALEEVPCGNAILSQDVWELDQLERVWAYDSYYKGIGQTYFNAGKLFQAGDDNSRAFIAVARSHFDCPFSHSDKQKLQLILPHLARALFINKTLLNQEATIEALGDSFERLSAAIIMLNVRGSVLYANKNAAPFLAKGQNTNCQYSIRLPNGAANLQLSRKIEEVLNGSVYQEGACFPFYYHGERYIAYCFSWCGSFNHQEWFGEKSRCIVFIISSASFNVTTRYLTELFKLSNAEANIAEGLIRGLSTKELSQTLFVSESTIRFHVKNILKKTETKSQIAAVSVMLRAVVVSVR